MTIAPSPYALIQCGLAMSHPAAESMLTPHVESWWAMTAFELTEPNR